jgi:membrane protein DedA with SNARE-associated domain
MNMISIVLEYIALFAKDTILFLGYPGILILMSLESMIFPMPSELVMPFAGFLVAEGKFNFFLIMLFSSLGSIIGSLLSYYIGFYGGKRAVLKFGKYLLLDVSDLEKTEAWFKRRGEKIIFISRFIPVVRHLISVPAGIGKMNLKKFVIYTLIGATLWNAYLAYMGYLLGKNWQIVRNYSEYISIIVFVVILLFGIFFIYRHIKNKKRVVK